MNTPSSVSHFLEDVPRNIKEFYSIEFSLSVCGTGIFLHQRKQDPCENAQRFERKAFPRTA